jgi:hypothetical protein
MNLKEKLINVCVDVFGWLKLEENYLFGKEREFFSGLIEDVFDNAWQRVQLRARVYWGNGMAVAEGRKFLCT